MQILNNELKVQRGETFTLDFLLENKDGSPYIVSNQLTNPYFLLTIASSKNTTKGRYLYNAWCKIPTVVKTLSVEANFNRFYYTNPIKITTFDSFPNGLSQTIKDEIAASGGTLTYVDYGVYYTEDSNGNRVYKYCSAITQSGGTTTYILKEYSCRFIKTFTTSLTNTWIDHEYTYGIQLVDGTENTDSSADSSAYRPLTDITFAQVILAPTKLLVSSNISGSF